MTICNYKGLSLCFNQHGYYAVIKDSNRKRLRYLIKYNKFKDTVTGKRHNGYYKDLASLKSEIDKIQTEIEFDNLLRKGVL